MPPSSIVTCFIVAAAAAYTRRPVGTEPVSETLAMRGSVARASPTAPAPCTTLKRPAGSPASCRISATFRAQSGVASDGLNTIAQPAASAGAAFQQAICVG